MQRLINDAAQQSVQAQSAAGEERTIPRIWRSRRHCKSRDDSYFRGNRWEVRPRGFEALTFGSGDQSLETTDDHRRRTESILQGNLATCDSLQQPPSTTDCQPIVSRRSVGWKAENPRGASCLPLFVFLPGTAALTQVWRRLRGRDLVVVLRRLHVHSSCYGAKRGQSVILAIETALGLPAPITHDPNIQAAAVYCGGHPHRIRKWIKRSCFEPKLETLQRPSGDVR